MVNKTSSARATAVAEAAIALTCKLYCHVPIVSCYYLFVLQYITMSECVERSLSKIRENEMLLVRHRFPIINLDAGGQIFSDIRISRFILCHKIRSDDFKRQREKMNERTDKQMNE